MAIQIFHRESIAPWRGGTVSTAGKGWRFGTRVKAKKFKRFSIAQDTIYRQSAKSMVTVGTIPSCCQYRKCQDRALVLAEIHAICFSNELSDSIQALSTGPDLRFELDIDNSETPKHFELVYAAFSCCASRSKKSRQARFFILIVGGSILHHDNFDVFDDSFEEGVWNAGEMHWKCRHKPGSRPTNGAI